MYKRQKMKLLIGMVLLFALLCQGCSHSVGQNAGSTQDTSETTSTQPTESVETEEVTEEPTEEVEEIEKLASVAPQIGTIKITSSWIGHTKV